MSQESMTPTLKQPAENGIHVTANQEAPMTQTKTTDYEICDYGIDNAQYFQGHGVSFTRYAHCSLGIGSTYAEALDDALECAAEEGFDIELDAEDQPANWEGKGPDVESHHAQYCNEEDHSECDSELYYYVGLRWN
jgi:hypothetical protein